MITLVLIGLPLLFALVVFILRGEKTIRLTALLGSLITFGWAVVAWVNYAHFCKCSVLFKTAWLAGSGVSLQFGMDGISMLLVMLTTFLVPVIIGSAWKHLYLKPAAFFGLILLLETAFLGVFTAFDGLVFYIFWELALICAWFICAVWGGKDRIRITFKFFIFTFTGSLLILAALLFLYFRSPAPHSFDYRWLYDAQLTTGEQRWIFAAMVIGFAVKIPVFPLHTWQPETYTTAPAQGTMLLAGIMGKMGIYGTIRWLIPVVPEAVAELSQPVIILAITGILYASLIALRQDDLKRLVAYSSIAHMGLITAGLFTLRPEATDGAVIQMVSHGINVVGLFCLLGFIEAGTGTRSMADLGGLANQAPWLAAFFRVILLGFISLPMTNGFVGEFILLLNLFETNILFAAVAGLTIIFSAVYMLWMYQRVMLGDPVLPGRSAGSPIRDLSPAEVLVLIPLVIMIFWIGIAPGMFLKLITL